MYVWEYRSPSSDRNHQHHLDDGHTPRPHLTLFPLHLCRCIPRRTPSVCKTTASFAVVVILVVGTDTNPHIHDNSTIIRTPTPRLHPIPDSHPQRRDPDYDTSTSRPKTGQRSHHRFQRRGRCPRVPVHRSWLAPPPALQKEEAATSSLAESGPTTGDEPFAYHHKNPRRYPASCFPEVVGLRRLNAVHPLLVLIYVFIITGILLYGFRVT